jgi:hypothetical protein
MNEVDLLTTYGHPVVIGGIGGSGTRLIAQCLQKLGFFIGPDLNKSSDNLWFTLLFKRIEILSSSEEEFTEAVEVLVKGMTGGEAFTKRQVDLIKDLASRDREQHPAPWLSERAATLLAQRQALEPNTRWGWKEPNSHIILDRLKAHFENMKYIHVVRNGLDMAHSKNQNQLRLWGGRFICQDFDVLPYYSLRFWCIVHRRVLDIGRSMGANFFFLNYDHLSLHPEDGITDLCQFLGLDLTITTRQSLLRMIDTPKSIGRFKQYGVKIFAPADLAYVKELGFDIEENGSSTGSGSVYDSSS